MAAMALVLPLTGKQDKCSTSIAIEIEQHISKETEIYYKPTDTKKNPEVSLLKIGVGVSSFRRTETQCFISGWGGTNTYIKLLKDRRNHHQQAQQKLRPSLDINKRQTIKILLVLPVFLF